MTSMTTIVTLLVSVLLLALSGCAEQESYLALIGQGHPLPSATGAPRPVVEWLQQQVRPALQQHVAAQETSVIEALSNAKVVPGGFKRPLVLQTLADPWEGMMALELYGSRLAELAASGTHHLPELIREMEAGMDRAPDSVELLTLPSGKSAEDQVLYMVAVLQQAGRLRERAVRKLSEADQRFLFDHGAVIAERFSPQVVDLEGGPLLQAQTDWRFHQLVAERLDYRALIAAALATARLADERWLDGLRQAFQGHQGGAKAPDGISGDVVLVRGTPSGLIVIGGPGPNSYELDQRFALVVDLGGDDTYRGTIASPAAVGNGISVVIDLGGNDTYHASPLGLATGRLGVGLLVDRAGDDLYHLARGSGGAGFAGLGLLIDIAGRDQYIGTRFTQGAAVGGLGLLMDRAGDDTFTSFGYAVGFGGPLGVGAVIDAAGDDQYQCGEKYPSAYNAAESPKATPADSSFQYDCFGLGAGSGKRVLTKDPQHQSYGLAGGWGILLDLQGDDRYRSSNFSQGSGYFFGTGLKLDFAGNDEHDAARYGHAASAHYGLGLFVDYRGSDRYASTGPFYTGGVAWDRSIALCIDAGEGDDRYDLTRSDGLGRADYHSWSLFIEEGGKDRYQVPNGMGLASNGSLSGFFDLAGEDDYALVPRSASGGRGNGKTLVDQAGGLFEDR